MPLLLAGPIPTRLGDRTSAGFYLDQMAENGMPSLSQPQKPYPALNYPPSKINVYVCDDGGRDPESRCVRGILKHVGLKSGLHSDAYTPVFSLAVKQSHSQSIACLSSCPQYCYGSEAAGYVSPTWQRKDPLHSEGERKRCKRCVCVCEQPSQSVWMKSF